MPTKEQIQSEVEKLKEMKPRVRHFTAFGDDNRAAIGVQVKVLEESLSANAIYDRWEDLEHLCDEALYARYWLDGDEEKTPSVGWELLVQK